MVARPKINVGVYCDQYNKRAKLLTQAFAEGIKRCGDIVHFEDPERYIGYMPHDVAVFYGLKGKLPKVFADYKRAGKHAILIDLGFWERHYNGRLSGYHKIVVNDYHPTDYPHKTRYAADRLYRLKLPINPFRKGGQHILVAGMSEKAAGIYGHAARDYEQGVITKLRKLTDRRIIYRPKPSWPDAKPLEGADYSPPDQPLENVLHSAFAVVTHHSNVAIDAIVAGVPAFVVESIAKPLCKTNIAEVNDPYYPSEEERLQWLQNAAYLQWHVAEIEMGLPWRHLKEEKIV